MKLLSENWDRIVGRKVLVRCNFDVPIENKTVVDTTRIEDCGETLRLLLDHGAKLILISHYDRPDGKDEAKSLLPVLPILENMLGETVAFDDSYDDAIVNQLAARIVLLENLRFWKGEYDNDDKFVKLLSKMGDFYVNEAFANCHRMHASMVGVPKLLDAFAGLHLEREVKVLEHVRSKPERPFVIVLGGAKLETKEPLVTEFLNKADKILVGGKISIDLKIKDVDLPNNVLLADSSHGGKEISESSARDFANEIIKAKTVIWNGTMGVFEQDEYREGTRIIADAMNKTNAFTVVGGGDTESALTILNLEYGIDHISTGGGAMLKFLMDGNLPALKVLGYQSS